MAPRFHTFCAIDSGRPFYREQFQDKASYSVTGHRAPHTYWMVARERQMGSRRE